MRSTHQNQAGRPSSSSEGVAPVSPLPLVDEDATGSVGSAADELSDGGADVSSGLSDAVGGSDWPGDSDAEPDAVGDVDWLGESLVDRDGDLLGERVGLGSDAVIDPLGEGRSTDPSSPHEVRSMTSISPAEGIAAARIRIVRMVIIVAEAFLWHDVADKRS